jgi:hypothetical protein
MKFIRNRILIFLFIASIFNCSEIKSYDLSQFIPARQTLAFAAAGALTALTSLYVVKATARTVARWAWRNKGAITVGALGAVAAVVFKDDICDLAGNWCKSSGSSDSSGNQSLNIGSSAI